MLDLSNIPHKELSPIIDKIRAQVKQHPVTQRMFKEYGVDLDEIDLVPMAFANLDVSARTDHAIIYLNIGLLDNDNFKNDDHYLVHELTHYLQQTTGNKPTKGADSGNYLDNNEEIEGFQNQTEYLADTKGDEAAEQYVDGLLDHHDVSDKKERDKRKEKLLEFAGIK